MDNVSHSLAGWALSRAAGTARPAGTTLTLVLASNLPDLDLVLLTRGEADYLFYHRGLTHSLVGLALFPPLLAAGLWWGLGRRTSFRWLWLLATCGVGLHLVYDVVTPWGTLLLYPFDVTRFALDWLFIVDLVTWILPCLALLWARRRPHRSRAAAAALLLTLALYGGAAGAIHSAGRVAVSGAERGAGRAPVEIEVVPAPAAPLRWTGYALASPAAPGRGIARYEIRGLPPSARLADRVDWGFSGPWVRRALREREAQAYLWWARVPVARVAADGSGGSVTVTLHDLRYIRTIGPTAETWTPFGLRLRFDRRTGALLGTEW